MRHLPSDKYNIAWFKLAECVARGEKERALAVYRLLAHSLADRALARQLEGDLLWSFNDEQAVQKYYEAGLLYQKDQRDLQAAGLYEHVINLAPGSETYLTALVNVYKKIKSTSKLCAYGAELAALLLEKNKQDEVQSLLTGLEQHLSSVENVILYSGFITHLIRRSYNDKGRVLALINTVLDKASMHDDPKLLSQFLATLQALDHQYYQHAFDYLANRTA